MRQHVEKKVTYAKFSINLTWKNLIPNKESCYFRYAFINNS